MRDQIVQVRSLDWRHGKKAIFIEAGGLAVPNLTVNDHQDQAGRSDSCLEGLGAPGGQGPILGCKILIPRPLLGLCRPVIRYRFGPKWDFIEPMRGIRLSALGVKFLMDV